MRVVLVFVSGYLVWNVFVFVSSWGGEVGVDLVFGRLDVGI